MTDKYYELMRSHRDWENYINNELMSLGVPQDLHGYYYLMVGIMLSAEDINLAIKSITKELYPKIADICDTTPLRVERCMRHAIENIGSYEIFGNTYSAHAGNPTNSAFIAFLANKVRRAF